MPFGYVTTRCYVGVRLEMEFSGVGVAWTDVSRDLRMADGISFDRGIQGNGPNDRVAASGAMRFTLDNSEHNSAGKLGYYTRLHANARAGFRIGIRCRLSLLHKGVVYTKFVGTLDSATPTTGRLGDRKTLCTAVDWIDDAARFKLSGLAAMLDTRADDVIETVLASMTSQPISTDLDQGNEIYLYALDTARDESTTALTELQRLAASELGYVYVKGDGTLRFEGRHVRSSQVQNALVLDGTHSGLMAPIARDRGPNVIQVYLHPRSVDDAATTVLYSHTSTPLLQLGESITFTGAYTDPTQASQRVGGTDMVTPVAVTDYTMNTVDDGSGVDLTSDFTVTATFGGNSATFTVTNNGTVPGYVTKLQARGRGLYDYEAVFAEDRDDDSIAEVGEISAGVDMPYQDDLPLGTLAAQYLVSLYSSPEYNVDSVTVRPNIDEMFMARCLRVDIGSRVGINDTVTGLSVNTGMSSQRGYFVQSEHMDIAAGGLLSIRWGLAPADVQSFWVLEVPGASELGVTTRLGFF